ncbi:hypothetical protein POM88_032166 [Heracleum sosnowskyi]|uniref:Uncharacterized protein n=1 Tax=Heracleum sosnowskyi TaxID=360622 RepID=A0AAD8I102_9APIA|nr:hypothetical protein POM88_032166 [Heracleum sosnowskyi]
MQIWRKDIKRCHTRVKISYNVMSIKIETQRFEKICNAFYGVVEMTMDDNFKCQKVMDWVSKLKHHLQSDASVTVTENPISVGATPNHDPVNQVNEVEHPKILDHVIVRGKRRPPTNRKISDVEKVITKKRK